MKPKQITEVQRFERILITVKPSDRWVIISIHGHKVEVPSSKQVEIQTILQRYPYMIDLFIGLLMKYKSKPPQSRLTLPTTKGPRGRPVRSKPTAKKVPPKTKRTTKKPSPTTIRTKKTTTTTRRKPTPKRKPSGTTTNKGRSGGFYINASIWGTFHSNMVMPDFSVTRAVTAVPGIDSKSLILLGYLFSQPNYFSVIYQMLIQLGFKFPTLSEPIKSVKWGNLVIPFPQPLVVSYTVKVAGGTFLLPRDAQKLALYLSTHEREIVVVASLLRKIGGVFSIRGGSQITGFTIFNQSYSFTKPVVTEVIVNGRSYVLPKDIGAILVAVKNNPKEFYRIKILLEAFGVRFEKSNDHLIQGLVQDKRYGVHILPGVRIRIDNKHYDIPADLESIFKSSDGLKVGALLSALQEKGVPVKVDEKTGVIVGIIIHKVLVPFPYVIDLRFKMGTTLYLIPRDLKKLIAVLEKKNMPTKILSILYNRYGVIPVRNADNVVIAVSFNGKKYPVKVQPLTAVVIRSRRFLLPRDTSKMVDFVASFKGDEKIGFEFLKALKVAGFMLINDDDGAMRSIQKGAQVINLDMELRIRVIYGKETYKVPKDLMRLVKEIRKHGPSSIKRVTDQLKAFDVEVRKKGKKLTILFNSVMYVVDLQSGSVKG